MMHDVERHIRQFFIDAAWLDMQDELLSTDSLLEKGIIDSVAMMELISFIEESYDLQIPDDDLMPENFDSLASIVAYVRTKQEVGI